MELEHVKLVSGSKTRLPTYFGVAQSFRLFRGCHRFFQYMSKYLKLPRENLNNIHATSFALMCFSLDGFGFS